MADELGLDLVEISAKADPPVCRILDYQKYLYQQRKKAKEMKQNASKIVIKEIRFGPNTDEHDFQFKLKHAQEFLSEGSKVKASIFFRGRSIMFADQGEKQLLCITRVMLDLPPMLILDEATSSIDTRTEIRIQRAFAKMMKGRTSFVVAHRLSTIKESDVILVMKDGHIIELGNHETLLAKGGFYTNLYNSQFAR